MTTQQLPGVDELLHRFHTFRYSAVRLETLQVYANSGEDEQIAAFRRGDPYTADAAEREYAADVRADRAAGKSRRRVHIVVEPLTDYLAYELTWEYGPHVAAGEEIRILDATGGWPDDVPREDFWLFDSRHRYDLLYTDTGAWRGAQPARSAGRLAEACAAWDAAWHLAVPWARYVARHPDLRRRVPEPAV